MNHAELSKELAIAIGYEPESVRNGGDCVVVYRHALVSHFPEWLNASRETWVLFDYRDPSVALAMVELLLKEGGEFMVHPKTKEVVVYSFHAEPSNIASASALPEAAARAVISLKGIK